MAVPYHTHTFEIPSATRSEVEAGVRADVAATPASLGSAASKDVSYFATSSQGGKADTAVQPTLTLMAGDGLTGGGTLASNRSFALSSTSIASLALANTAVQNINGKSGASVLLTAADVSAVPASFSDDIVANTAARHTHANKPILDAMTAAYTTAEKTKLLGIPADADKTPDLATVATSGKYTDLHEKPTLGALAAKDSVVIADLAATGTPSAATFLRGDNTWVTVSGSGTVTSVGVAVPTGLAATGAITTSGTITISYASGYQGYTTAEANKLAGIATGATANQADAYLLARANHTGTQAISTVSGLQASLDSKFDKSGGTVTGNVDATGYIQATGDLVTQGKLFVGATNVIDEINAKASIGSGQWWQDVTGLRSNGTTYVNNTGRAIFVSLQQEKNGLQFVLIKVNEYEVVKTYDYNGGGSNCVAVSTIVPNGSSYSYHWDSTYGQKIAELRN